MLSVWKHFTASATHCCWGLRKGKDFVQAGFWVPFFFFSKCVAYLVLQRRWTQFPLIVHVPASSCSHLSWALASSPLALPGRTSWECLAQPQHCQLCCHAWAPAVLQTLSRWALREVVIKNKRKKDKKSACEQLFIGIPRLCDGCSNDSVLQVCIYLLMSAKWQRPSLQPVF